MPNPSDFWDAKGCDGTTQFSMQACDPVNPEDDPPTTADFSCGVVDDQRGIYSLYATGITAYSTIPFDADIQPSGHQDPVNNTKILFIGRGSGNWDYSWSVGNVINSVTKKPMILTIF